MTMGGVDARGTSGDMVLAEIGVEPGWESKDRDESERMQKRSVMSASARRSR